MSPITRILPLAAALALVACGGGGGGGTGALRPDTSDVGRVSNTVLPGTDTSATAGQNVAVQSTALTAKAVLSAHRWTIEQISGATAAADKAPKVVDAGCSTAAVSLGEAPTGSKPGKDASSVCRTNIAVPTDAPASEWLVTSVASTSSMTDSKKFVLRVTPVDARIGLSLTAPTVPQVVTAGQTASITASSAVNAGVSLDTPVTYEWSQVAGAQVPIAGANTATMSFVPREEGDFAFKVIASATSAGRTDTKQATVVVTAKAPGVTRLGLTLSVPTVPQVFEINSPASIAASHSIGGGITLDAPATYTWTQVSGTNVALAGSNTPTVSFIPRTAEDFVLKVRVSATSGGQTETKESNVVVSVPDTTSGESFLVSAGDSQVVTAPTAVLLSGSVQTGSPGPGYLTYRWTQLSGPAVTIANASTPDASFIADGAGDYSFELAVTSSTTTRRSVTTVKATAPATP